MQGDKECKEQSQRDAHVLTSRLRAHKHLNHICSNEIKLTKLSLESWILIHEKCTTVHVLWQITNSCSYNKTYKHE